MGGEVTTVQPSQAVVASPGGWTRERIELVKRTICKGATDDELLLFQEVCERTGLDPFKKQIYGIKRYDSSVGDKVLRAEASIDGLRLIAQRSGQYAGQVGPEWCGEDGVWRDVWLDKGQPAAARVGVIRKGFTHPVYAVALWREYAQLKKDGTVNSMWGKYGSVMLAKCAESLALRKAFPDDMSGVYTTDEMGAVSDDGMGSAAVEDGGLEGVTQFRDTQSIPSAQHEAKAAIGNARGVFGKDEADTAIRGILEEDFGGKRFADLDDEELRRLAAALTDVTTREVRRRQADDVVQMPGEPVDAEYEELPPDGLNPATRSFQVEGSKGDEYTIDVYEDGSWDCSCPARVDDCKHVKNLRRPYVAEDGSEAGWLWPGDGGYDNAPPSDTAVAEKVERTLAREVEPKPEHPLVEDGDGPQSEGAVVAELVEHGKALGLTEEEVMLTIARAGRGVAENLTKPHVKLSAKGAIGIAAREKKGEVITGD